MMNILSFLNVLFNKKGCFFICPRFLGRKRKGGNVNRTNVLMEGMVYGKEGGDYADHQSSKGRGKREAEEGKEEGGRKQVVFEVREDGNSWQHENILMCRDGSSTYLVYILGRDEEDTIECRVPHIWAMINLLSSLNYGKGVLFTSSAGHKPTGQIE